MSKQHGKAIRFKIPWQGRAKGSIDRALAPGVMQTLVDNHRAEWVVDDPPRKRREKAESAKAEVTATTDQ